MTDRTVRDVIGEPATWPNDLSESIGPLDMVGARVYSAFCMEERLAIQTTGSANGMTLATFGVADPDLCDRIIVALWPGRDLYEGLAAAIDK
jgi:hypothetical protein